MLVAEAMNSNPVTLPTTATARQAAQAMRDNDIGDVLVVDRQGKLKGIVTDRDIAVRDTHLKLGLLGLLRIGRVAGLGLHQALGFDASVTRRPTDDLFDLALRLGHACVVPHRAATEAPKSGRHIQSGRVIPFVSRRRQRG